jgi:hypothetical protein
VRRREGGIIVALSFGKGAYEEAARAKLEQGVEIELKTIEDMLKETWPAISNVSRQDNIDLT